MAQQARPVQGVLAAFPDAKAVTIMAAHEPLLRIEQIKSPRAGCIEFHLMGKCIKETSSSYLHVPVASQMGDTKAEATTRSQHLGGSVGGLGVHVREYAATGRFLGNERNSSPARRYDLGGVRSSGL
jgi:hypothetical protein